MKTDLMSHTKHAGTIHPQYANIAAFRSFVDNLPQSFDNGGTLLYDKRNTIKRFHLEGMDTDFVVKRFHRPTLPQRVLYTFFRATKSSRAYRNGLELLRRNVNTPFPLAYVDFQEGRLVSDTYYICAACSWIPIADVLNAPACFDKDVALAFAQFAATLHRRGILHGDLNSTNTLFHNEADGTIRFAVIDINRMEFTQAGQVPWRKCGENLTRFTGRMDLFEFVARHYVEIRGLDSEAVSQLLAHKHRHDKQWRRRKNFLRFLKRVFKLSR